MENMKKGLWELFKSYLIRKEKGSPVTKTTTVDNDFKVIKFYEWSDVDKPPITFYGEDGFYKFMQRCGIIVYGYQKDVIKGFSECHITCKKGEKTLLIRKDKQLLKEALGMNYQSNTQPAIMPPVGGYEYMDRWDW